MSHMVSQTVTLTRPPSTADVKSWVRDSAHQNQTRLKLTIVARDGSAKTITFGPTGPRKKKGRRS